jgi:hypothetical protein
MMSVEVGITSVGVPLEIFALCGNMLAKIPIILVRCIRDLQEKSWPSKLAASFFAFSR